jgi:hypothetical protein
MITIILLLTVFVYIAIVSVFAYNNHRRREVEALLSINTEKPKDPFMFGFERKFLYQYKIKPKKVVLLLWIERIAIIAALVAVVFVLKALAIAAVGAIVTVFLAKDAYDKVLFKSGVQNISHSLNFINFFTPHLISGDSADQALLGYIEYTEDPDISEFYQKKDDADYVVPSQLTQISEAYSIAKYSEETGSENYIDVLQEFSEDMAQKQTYYNNFLSRMGGIKPITWAYYIFVPVLIAVPWSYTADFWSGIWGIVDAIVILGLFVACQFLIYKIKKNTIILVF